MDVGALAVVEQSDKELVLVEVLIRRADLLKGNAVLDVGIDRREDAPVDGEQMRHEGDFDVLAAELGERLLDLGGVAVRCDLVGMEALVELGEMTALRGLSSGARHAALAVADDALCGNQSLCNRGSDRKRRAGGVAAGVRNQLLALDVLSEKLGQTVDALLVQRFIKEGAAVPFGVLVLALEAEVRAEVDERLACGDALFRKLLRKAVRQRGEDHVALFNDRVLILADHIVEEAVGGIDVAELLTLKGYRADRGDLRFGVRKQQTHQLGACIAGCPDDSCFYLCIHFNQSLSQILRNFRNALCLRPD